jgi:hypothetical protein
MNKIMLLKRIVVGLCLYDGVVIGTNIEVCPDPKLIFHLRILNIHVGIYYYTKLIIDLKETR